MIFTDDFNARPAWPTWTISNYLDRSPEPQILLNDPDNIFVSSGNLYIRTIKENYTYNGKTYPYTSGWIQTVATYKYGYFEIKAICPSGKGYWPAFWLQTGADYYCTYNEIDIFENDGGNQYYRSNNMHYQTASCESPHLTNPQQVSNSPVQITGTWHLWGCEWTPDNIIFYLDGNELRRIPNINQNQLMPIILNQSLYFDSRAPDYSTPLYGDLIIDYLKVYPPVDNCNQIQTILDFNTYIYGVKNTITVGNGSSLISVPTSTSVMLRAVNGITINPNFEVPLGSEFGAILTPCY